MATQPSGIGPGDRLYLIDGSGYIFRAYHALPPLSRKSDGLPTGAVAGFCSMLHKLLEEMSKGEKPTHLAVVFDASERTFRNALYPEYKAHRPPAPEDLAPQFPLVREAVRAFNVACVEQLGYEADDLIATYARAAAKAGARVTIVSSDKDLMQLVEDGRIELLDTMKNKRLAAAEVIEKFGVPPSKVVDVQALAGDSVDNVPGVPGIGVKTAAELINAYGDLDALLARASEIKQPKRRESLIAHEADARISRQLVTLKDDVPVERPLADFSVRPPDPKTLIAFLKGMEFTTLTRRVAAEHDADAEAIDPASVARGEAAAPLTRSAAKPEAAAGQLGAVMDAGLLRRPFEPQRYVAVTVPAQLETLIAAARDRGRLALDLVASEPDPMRAEIVGIACALGPGEAAYIPLRHGKADGLSFSDAPQQLAPEAVLSALKPLLEDPGVLKIGHDLKHDTVLLARAGVALDPVDDALLMVYALDGGKGEYDLPALAQALLDHRMTQAADVLGSGRQRTDFAALPPDAAARFAGEQPDAAFRVHAFLKGRLAAERKVAVYETLERPLIRILSDMEQAGIAIDTALLRRLSDGFARRMAALEQACFALAGETFNLGSPKQLGDILFGKLGLPGGRKTKTGAWSTDADVLEELAAAHDLPAKLLEWRQISKLKGTYTDALPGYIHARTGRVHTSFQMASTTTGRLSSSEPNIQNIPIRTEEGRQIRTAFVAAPGHLLISADYSQIELRLLAHIAAIPQLKKAFADGMDIHTLTASEMFGVPVEGMPGEVRRRAKAINFGIIYGISAFGLGNQLGIPQSEAAAYIKRYFERFPGIRDYMERTKALAHKQGFVETLFGRRVWVPQIRSKSMGERANGERAAINAPIQGSAADVMRRAMVRIPPALRDAGLSARMLLQVHDELVFECPQAEAQATCALVARVMARASAPAVDLAVPLTVEARAGRTWGEAH